MTSDSAPPVTAAAVTPETQPDATQGHSSQNSFSGGRERFVQTTDDDLCDMVATMADSPTDSSSSPCDPYLNFDGILDEFADNRSYRSQTAEAEPRSMPSSASIAESTADSVATTATSLLPALQTKGYADDSTFEPLREEEMDPKSFDLVAPSSQEYGVYSLEKRSELLFSKEHMGTIVGSARLLGQFTQFLYTVRPASVPLLTYYLETEKAIRAIKYANAMTEALKRLEGHDFTSKIPEDTFNESLQDKHDAAFEALARDELPMFITHVWIQMVSLSIKHRIVGTMPMHLRDSSEGLAEVFCLTDPSRHDNPIILASDEFHRTTQYGINYVIGRNCRFLQGPGTNPFSVKRIRDRILAGKEHFETFLNYRRDGSPFLNLLLCAPLIDSRGKVRYFLGAQVDVSGLANECAGLEGLKELVEAEEHKDSGDVDETDKADKADKATIHKAAKTPAQCCRELSEMFDRNELDGVRRHGGIMHQPKAQERYSRRGDHSDGRPYLVIEDGTSPQESPSPTDDVSPLGTGPGETLGFDPGPNGRLTGVYKHYLLVRPAPSFQILFASPSLRVPGILQSPFLSRIGGSGRVRNQIAQTLTDGHGVTARVRWLSSTRRRKDSEPERGRPRWLHCTPLRGVNGTIGIWMIVIVDEDDPDLTTGGTVGNPFQQSSHRQQHGLKPKLAPPVAHISRRPSSYTTTDGRLPAEWD